MMWRRHAVSRIVMLQFVLVLGGVASFGSGDVLPVGSDASCARHSAGGPQPQADQGSTDPTEGKASRFIQGYTDKVYAKMRDDTARTEAYARAISAIAPNKTVLDIGTGALALLALMAAKAGATKVIAVEGNEEAYHKAVQVVAEEGLSEVVTVIFGHSTKLNLPFKADMVVHEILGEIASVEGAARVIRDAQARHLSAFPSRARVSIPASAASFICPCEMPDGEYWSAQPFPVILPPGTTTLKLWKFPRRSLLCDEWLEMERLDFEQDGGLRLVDKRDLSFTVARDAVFSGFVIRMQANLLGEKTDEISTWCWDEETQTEGCQGHWAQQMVVFDAAGRTDLLSDAPYAAKMESETVVCAAVSAGDVVDLRVSTDTRTLQPTYSFQARLRKAAAAPSGERSAAALQADTVDLGEVVLDQPNTG